MAITPEYKEHMGKEHDGSNWGTTGWKYAGESMKRVLASRPYITTVLDFGCGKGTMKDFLQPFFPEVRFYEYDPGIPGKDTFPTGQFDMVMTSDVLEHIEPHLLTETIQQLEGLTKYVLCNDIACSPTFKTFGEGPYIGQDLHLIIEEPIWWRKRFAEDSTLHEAEYAHRDKASNKGPKTRCWLVHERTG